MGTGWDLAIIVAAVLVGTMLQRLSGTGVGLVVAPVLSLLFGPALGVLVTNMTTVVSGFIIMLSVLAAVDWRRYLLIAPAAVVGAVPGAWVVSRLPAGWLSILLGAIVLAALLVTVTLRRLPEWRSGSAAVLAGAIGGFFNTTSGVAAPVMVIYSRLSRWQQAGFAATMQPVFMTMGAVSVLSKLLFGSVDTDGGIGLSLGWMFLAIVVTVALGVLVAARLARRVPAARARRLAMLLAALGGAAAIVRGIIDVTV
ncbi:sulfite exporter TauE/SafE family protein [Microbacterium halophytorum]|uniref:sulfite exporter TauE/SafE family protein n=1 Tax=Microbacterium halophytorum TaxID=2067568 RepID=UPI000CFC1B20|nr:sulfite exporter TauE/SafE family protein [Microbacterium halophytorum]